MKQEEKAKLSLPVPSQMQFGTEGKGLTIRKELKMTFRFSKTVFYSTIILLCVALSSLGGARQTNQVRDGVFVHVSYGADNPHRLLMALKMAVTMAEGGKDVLVYCDIEAVKGLTTNAQAITFEHFPSSQTYCGIQHLCYTQRRFFWLVQQAENYLRSACHYIFRQLAASPCCFQAHLQLRSL